MKNSSTVKQITIFVRNAHTPKSEISLQIRKKNNSTLIEPQKRIYSFEYDASTFDFYYFLISFIHSLSLSFFFPLGSFSFSSLIMTMVKFACLHEHLSFFYFFNIFQKTKIRLLFFFSLIN